MSTINPTTINTERTAVWAVAAEERGGGEVNMRSMAAIYRVSVVFALNTSHSA